MRLRAEARAVLDLRDRVGERRLQAGGGRHVLDGPAAGADQVVVVPGELFGELEARRLRGHDAMHDAGLLQHDQVPVHRALRQAVAGLEDLGEGERTIRVGEHLDDRGTLGGEPLVHPAQTRRDLVTKIGRHAAECTVAPMDVTGRFAELVQRDDADVPLDEAALLIAAHDHELDISEQLARLDDLAVQAPASPDALATYLFVERAFMGNAVDYGDPSNSYLDHVLDRRLGLPITLSVLMIEIGRRRGLDVQGVGMPGHFLVRAGGYFFDPFYGGERLDEDGCRERFAAIRGAAPFVPSFLDPVGNRAILARMLANLVHTFIAREPPSAVWALRLRLAVPGISAEERREAASLLGTLGQFEEAAAALDAIAGQLDGADADRIERDAAAYRARAN